MQTRKALSYLLPPEWRDQIRKLRQLGLVSLGDVLGVAVLSVMTIVFEAFSVAMIMPLFDYIENGRNIEVLRAQSRFWEYFDIILSRTGLPISLLSLSIVVLILVTLRQVFSYSNVINLARLKQCLGRDLSARCFTSILSSQASYTQNFGTGNFVNLIDVQVQGAATLVRSYATLWIHLLTFLAYGMVMMVAAPIASLVALSMTAAMVVSLNRYVRLARQLSRKTVAVRQRFASFISERYFGWRVIKLSGALPRESENFAAWASQFFRISVDLFRVTGRIQVIITPVMTLFALGALYVSVEYLALTVSTITLFVLILMRLIPVSQNLVLQRQSIASHGASLDRVVKVLAECRRHREIDTGTREFKGLEMSIDFRDVSFTYSGNAQAALENVSVTIPAHKMTAFMGPSGAGKSTLADLLPRLVERTSGAITLDGTPIEEHTLASLRRQIAYASQDPFIFNDTVRENVRYGQSEATDEEVVEACKLTFVDEFIADLPDGYDTVLGERGSRLSGGQRQRLILARVMLAKASILILDEPTSALDYETERQVRAAIDNMVKKSKMTVLIIAHRMSTVRNADWVIVLDVGRVIEQGTPSDLRKDDKWYHAMLELEHTAPDVKRAETA